ncbi:signal peptidase I [Kitasatospora sp. NPDC097643]|uniref:signal peptidase I n=1 Tax=Kitasatospora sp. NPDC097643 TaxID=3157230 RepID=UPI003326EFB3
MRTRLRKVSAWTCGVGGALSAALGLAVVLTGYSPRSVADAAMAGGVEPGEHVITDRVQAADVQRGEVYLVDSPWTVRGPAVERVIAIGGDHLVSDHGRLVLNGRPLDEPYASGADPLDFDVTVPPGRAFLLGDRRDTAVDSRRFLGDRQGTVDLAKVGERVVWPHADTHPLPGKLVTALVDLILGAGLVLAAVRLARRRPVPASGDRRQATARAAARPAVRPEKRQPPRKVPSSER